MKEIKLFTETNSMKPDIRNKVAGPFKVVRYFVNKPRFVFSDLLGK